MFIPTAIFEVERSLKSTSTASRLMFVLPLSFLHHQLAFPTPIRHQPYADTRPRAPPLHLGMWAQQIIYRLPQKRDAAAAVPPPFPKGCGPLIMLDGRVGGKETRGGTHE